MLTLQKLKYVTFVWSQGNRQNPTDLEVIRTEDLKKTEGGKITLGFGRNFGNTVT